MKTQNREFIARIDWVAPDNGGRKELPMGNRYVPILKTGSAVFDASEMQWGASVENRCMLSGTLSTFASVRYLSPYAPDDLDGDVRFRLFEGPRLVAWGMVLRQRQQPDERSGAERKGSVKVYKLEAVDLVEDSRGAHEEIMLLGFFDSREACKAVERDYATLPGFSLPSCRFVYTPYLVDTQEDRPIDRLFYVQLVSDEFSDEEKVVEIGVFASHSEAEEGLAAYLSSEAARDTTEGICTVYINEHPINRREWQEGFERYSY